MSVAGVEALITDALLYRLSLLTTSPPLAVDWPGEAYRPVTGTPFLRPSVMHATSGTEGHIAWDVVVERRGTMQVSVFWPSNQGEVVPTQVAAQVVAHFARGTLVNRGATAFRLIEHPYLSPAIEETDWTSIPVTIPWRVVASAART